MNFTTSSMYAPNNKTYTKEQVYFLMAVEF